ncbi:MAG: ACP S-malonyltransferase [Coriobacteriia bacterium]|nr:ACP S-malonyltransferase [Coriobacteriia bacterium]
MSDASQIAFLFAGQGAQYPGMGAGLAEASPAAAAVFAAADTACPGTHERCLTVDAEELARTQVTQPTVLAVDLACARMLEEAGVHPAVVAGFSLGEIGALALAGVFDDRAAFMLIAERARLMDEAARATHGGMRAVLGKTAAELQTLLQESGQSRLEIANFNAPTQIVVSGPHTELAVLGDFLQSRGVRSVPLAVSGAFHSSFMRPAADSFAQTLAQTHFVAAQIPVYGNVTGEPYPLQANKAGNLSHFDEAQAKTLLAHQIASPVQWTHTLENLAAAGITHFVEVGPGAVLTGLVRKTLPGAWCRPVSNAEQARAAAAELKQERVTKGQVLCHEREEQLA